MASMTHRVSAREIGSAEIARNLLQGQYETQVFSMVVRDLAPVAPAAGESAVMELVADVWRQVEEHAKTSRTGWAHISWFVQNAITTFLGQHPQMAGC